MKRIAYALVVVSVAAHAQVLEISGSNFRPVPLAVPKPLTQDDGAQSKLAESDEAFVYDMTACGLFLVLDRKSYLSDMKEGLTAGSINFSNSSNVGADNLVKTQLSLEGDMLKAEL